MNLISIFRRLFLPLVVLLLAATAGAQSAYDEIKADIDKAGGVYFMYPFDTPSATPAPKGYEPFYISHYGRLCCICPFGVRSPARPFRCG